MDKIIPAKPTLFNGQMYRSRLDAKWAIFLHYLTKDTTIPHSIRYEPVITIHYGGNPAWRADFEITVGGYLFFIEAKPIEVNLEFRRKLRDAQKSIWNRGLKADLFLMVGDFYNGIPEVFTYPYHRELCLMTSMKIFEMVGDPVKASDIARTYRFDLRDEESVESDDVWSDL